MGIMWGARRGGIQRTAVWMCSRTSLRPQNDALAIPVPLTSASYLRALLIASQRLPGRISLTSASYLNDFPTGFRRDTIVVPGVRGSRAHVPLGSSLLAFSCAPLRSRWLSHGSLPVFLCDGSGLEEARAMLSNVKTSAGDADAHGILYKFAHEMRA